MSSAALLSGPRCAKLARYRSLRPDPAKRANSSEDAETKAQVIEQRSAGKAFVLRSPLIGGSYVLNAGRSARSAVVATSSGYAPESSIFHGKPQPA
jgi:hypothetical protein